MRIRLMPWAVVGAMIVSFATVGTAQAVAGHLDTTFGADGRVTTNFPGRPGSAYPMALQADGKIVVAGTAGFSRFGLARYNTDGSLDTSFGGNGKITTNFTRGDDIAYGVVVQADGKIVAGGTGAYERIALARYNADGSLDTSFSGNGKLTTDLTEHGDFAWTILLQPNGKIVAVGDAGVDGPKATFALVRYNPDGSLDTSFGRNGAVRTNFTSAPEDGLAALRLPTGGFVVAGGNGFGLPNEKFAIARYDHDGDLDTTFGGDGKVTTNFLPGPDVAFGVALQASGKLVVVGGSGLGGSRDPMFSVARYRNDGSLDPTFSENGKVVTNFTKGDDDAYSVAIQSDGKIVAAGQSGGRNPKFALARYNLNGSLDTTFSGDGRRTTDFTPDYDSIYSVVIQADGRILAAGTAGFSKFAVARYHAA